MKYLNCLWNLNISYDVHVIEVYFVLISDDLAVLESIKSFRSRSPAPRPRPELPIETIVPIIHVCMTIGRVLITWPGLGIPFAPQCPVATLFAFSLYQDHVYNNFSDEPRKDVLEPSVATSMCQMVGWLIDWSIGQNHLKCMWLDSEP